MDFVPPNVQFKHQVGVCQTTRCGTESEGLVFFIIWLVLALECASFTVIDFSSTASLFNAK